MKCFVKLFLFFFILLAFQKAEAQWISINENGVLPDTSAALDISSTSRGVLLPRMSSTDRLAIPSPAQGLLVFQTDGTIGFYYYTGAAWDTLGGATNVTNVSNVTNINNSGIAVLLDVKATNQDGGDFVENDWRKRDLNQLSGDVSFVSLDAVNAEFTLDSGTYVIEAQAPGYNVDQHQIRLYNNTTGSSAMVGSMARSGNLSSSTASFLTAVVKVSNVTEDFIIEHRCESTNNGDGFGQSSNWGDNVYTQVTIQKL